MQKIDLSCPQIDEVLKALKEVGFQLRQARKESEESGTIDAIERAELELWGLDDKLEKIRNINAQLRHAKDSLQDRLESVEE